MFSKDTNIEENLLNLKMAMKRFCFNLGSSRGLDGSGGLKLWRESVTRPLVSRQGGPKFLPLSPSPSIHIHIDSFLQFFFRKINGCVLDY